MPRTLPEWLTYQQCVHKVDIDLGLDRIREVWRRMGSPGARLAVIVGGTNGKGSTVAFLDSILRAMGLRTGAYISPHVTRYNERTCVDGVEADDATLCASFERIEMARGGIPLTYFEFATLAALDIFGRANTDVMVLEVGLGGRLDATNIVDADAAVVTTVDLDHMEWLGPTRDSIGAEQAAIARAGRPAIVGEAEPPRGLIDTFAALGARVVQAGVDFRLETQAGRTVWVHGDGSAVAIPALSLTAPCQPANAATAVAAVHALRDRLPWMPEAITRGLRDMRVRGRLQNLGHAPERFVDVAHNPQAARTLARWLDEHPVAGRTLAVFGALGDKDVEGVVGAVGARVDAWYLGGLDAASPRGLSQGALETRVRRALPDAVCQVHADVATAWQAALAQAGPADRIVAFGSFCVVAGVLSVAEPAAALSVA